MIPVISGDSAVSALQVTVHIFLNIMGQFTKTIQNVFFIASVNLVCTIFSSKALFRLCSTMQEHIQRRGVKIYLARHESKKILNLKIEGAQISTKCFNLKNHSEDKVIKAKKKY